MFSCCILPIVSFTLWQIDGFSPFVFPVSRGSWIPPPGFPSRRIRAAHCVNRSCTCVWKSCYSPRIWRKQLLVYSIPQHTHVYARWSTCVASISMRSTPLEMPPVAIAIAWAMLHWRYADMVLVHQRSSVKTLISIGNIVQLPRKAICQWVSCAWQHVGWVLFIYSFQELVIRDQW